MDVRPLGTCCVVGLTGVLVEVVVAGVLVELGAGAVFCEAHGSSIGRTGYQTNLFLAF